MHDNRQIQEHYAELSGTYRSQANRACERAYQELVSRLLPTASHALEIGAGSSDLLRAVGAPVKVACDLSMPMLRAFPSASISVCCDGMRLPFPDGSFDALVSINVLEHVPVPENLIKEIGRVLTPEGQAVLVTPDGGKASLLHILEQLHLKLPEGPHRFVTFNELRGMALERFHVMEHRRFLAFPAGPRWFVRLIDAVLPGWLGMGLFQYIHIRNRRLCACADSVASMED